MADLSEQAYQQTLAELKRQVQTSQLQALLKVNQELLMLYWKIGKTILFLQQEHGWGAHVVDQLARDLKAAFPGMMGFGRRNLQYMRLFAETYPSEEIVQATPAQLTWYHNTTLLDKVKDPQEREYYMQATLTHGWSRDVMVHQIETHLYHRQGKALHNFQRTLPPQQSELAQQLLKDPYAFEFLDLQNSHQERELERALLGNIRKLLLELGTGFAFMGSQYHLRVGEQDYYLDLLFYHVKLRCYVVIDLKITDFKPEFSGKMNFYIAAVNRLLKHENDHPTIGLILCKTRDQVITEVALEGITHPIGVSTYTLAPEIQAVLPTTRQLEVALSVEAQSPPFGEEDSAL